MAEADYRSLRHRLVASGTPLGRTISSANASVRLSELQDGSSLGERLDELHGRAVIIATRDQLTAALALIELDGVARRLVLCPPDLPADHLSSIARTAAAEALVSDQALPESNAPDVKNIVLCTPQIAPIGRSHQGPQYETEWILLTSGTTGVPKLVIHTLSTLTGAIVNATSPMVASVWSTFYDIRRYGGLQIFLRAILGGASLVLSDARESTGDFLVRAGAAGVTHMSGTPSHWRRALMSPMADRISPRYVRLSGEIADQTILDNLRAVYKNAKVAHAFASTEAGVAFDIDDGYAGFPARLISDGKGEPAFKVENGSLRIRSGRTAIRYLGSDSEKLADSEGFVDTGDMVELRGDRYYFVGRRGGIINVGGLKVHPEEVESAINQNPSVRMSLVRARKNPITGALVVAEVVLKDRADDGSAIAPGEALKRDIMETCHRLLAPHKVPAVINLVTSLDVSASGKLARRNG